MKRMYGDMWSAWGEADLFLITGNSCVNSHNKLVMGRGTAKQARDRFLGVDTALGLAVAAYGEKRKKPTYTVHWPYYLLVSPKWPQSKLGLFQTKEDWHHWSDLTIIHTAAEMLAEWIDSRARELGRKPVVHMPFPGVGNGQLSEADVLPYISWLPDSVFVWQGSVMRPQDPIALPEEYAWVEKISPGDVSAGALDNIIGNGATEGFNYLYDSLAEDVNGRLMQVLVTEAFASIKVGGKRRRMGQAHHQGLNNYRQIVNGS